MGDAAFRFWALPRTPLAVFAGQEEESSLTRRRSCSTNPPAITTTWRCWRILAACCVNDWSRRARSIEGYHGGGADIAFHVCATSVWPGLLRGADIKIDVGATRENHYLKEWHHENCSER